MEVWLVTCGEPLPVDGQGARLFRTGLLANRLADRGHRVTWWSSAFNHSLKQMREGSTHQLRRDGSLTLELLAGAPYEKNISIARIRNHRDVANDFARRANRYARRPDVVVASLPTLHLADTVTQFAAAMGVPSVVDIRDLWPDVMVEAAPARLRLPATVATAGMRHQAASALRRATAVVGISRPYLDWGLHLARRAPHPSRDRVIPIGYEEQPPPTAALAVAERFWDDRGVGADDGWFTLSFAGTLGAQSELEPAITAVGKLRRRGHRIRLVVCGTGERQATYERLAGQYPPDAVHLAGWVDAPALWVLLRRSHAGLVPYRESENYVKGQPNKPIEALSAGLPILTSLDRGVVADLVRTERCGVSYGFGPGAPKALTKALEQALDDPEGWKVMARNAERVFADNFTATAMAANYEDLLLELVAR